MKFVNSGGLEVASIGSGRRPASSRMYGWRTSERPSPRSWRVSVTSAAPASPEPPPSALSTLLAAESSESMIIRSRVERSAPAWPWRTASMRIAALSVLAAGNWASALTAAPQPVIRCCT